MATTNKTNEQNRTSQQHRTQSHQSRSSSQTRREGSWQQSTKPAAELFEQAMSSYEQAFKTGLRLQEESGRWWTTFLEQSTPTAEWQKTVRTMAREILPEAQRRMEDGLRLVEQNSRASLELLRLFKRTVEVPQSNPMAESQTKLLHFWEASLNSMRDGAQAVAQANTHALESWMELFRKGSEMAAERARV